MSQLGTLIIVIIRARNLSNKVIIGKQNPYTTITYGLTKKRTTAIERGGQTPVWDQEFRFDIPSNLNDFVSDQEAILTKTGGVELVKNNSIIRVEQVVIVKKELAKILRIACFADDSRDPKLLGEAKLDLEEIIKKGTFDEWVPLIYKARPAGEIYIEMTFYSNAPPPAAEGIRYKKSRASYGGPGIVIEEGGEDLNRLGSGIIGNNNNLRNGRTPSPGPYRNDYPDSDFGPLASTFSNMSLRAAQPPSSHNITPRPLSSNSQNRNPALPPLPRPPSQQRFYEEQNYDYHPTPVDYSQTYHQPPPPPLQQQQQQQQQHYYVQPPPPPPPESQSIYSNHYSDLNSNYLPRDHHQPPPQQQQYQQQYYYQQQQYQLPPQHYEPNPQDRYQQPQQNFNENSYSQGELNWQTNDYYDHDSREQQQRQYSELPINNYTSLNSILPPPPIPNRNYDKTTKFQNPPRNFNQLVGGNSIHSPIPTLPPSPPTELINFIDPNKIFSYSNYNLHQSQKGLEEVIENNRNEVGRIEEINNNKPPLPPLPPTFFKSGPRNYDPYNYPSNHR